MNPAGLTLIVALGCAIAGCTAPTFTPPPPRGAGDTCVAAHGQAFLGRRADAQVGGELLRVTNSRELRWVGPDMAVTMDYKYGRLTVGYDAAMIIRSVACT